MQLPCSSDVVSLQWLLANTPVLPYEELMDEIRAAPAEAGDTDTDMKEERRISILNSSKELQATIISLFHNNPECGHFGILKTVELLSRYFYWLGLEQSVRAYLLSCELCHGIKAHRHARHGLLMPISAPKKPWERLTMDFVTNFPPSRRIDAINLYSGILVVAHRLATMAIYPQCRKDIDSPELGRLFFEHVICRHRLPDNLITDRGRQFYSRFWKQVCSHLSIDHRLSRAFHPQTHGQTEKQNQTIEHYLRA